MANQARRRRLGDRILQELAEILQREVSDPRRRRFTVTGVEIDRELAYATIFVTAAAAGERSAEILEGLERARGFLRSELARRIPLRTFPQLRFRWDASTERGARIEELLHSLKDGESGTDGQAGTG